MKYCGMDAAVTNALDEALHAKLHGVNPQGSGFTPCCHVGWGSLPPLEHSGVRKKCSTKM
jgi:hypothetical protein